MLAAGFSAVPAVFLVLVFFKISSGYRGRAHCVYEKSRSFWYFPTSNHGKSRLQGTEYIGLSGHTKKKNK